MDFEYDPIQVALPCRLTDEELVKQSEANFRFQSERRTVRDFSDEPIDRAVIEVCVLSAGRVPSGANHQPWYFACVSDPDIKRAIREAAEAEVRAFYGGRAGQAWVNDLKKLVPMRSSRFWKRRHG